MTDAGIALAGIATVAIPLGVVFLANQYGQAVARQRRSEFQDRVNTVPESYAEALEMIAANSDKPIMTYAE